MMVLQQAPDIETIMGLVTRHTVRVSILPFSPLLATCVVVAAVVVVRDNSVDAVVVVFCSCTVGVDFGGGVGGAVGFCISVPGVVGAVSGNSVLGAVLVLSDAVDAGGRVVVV